MEEDKVLLRIIELEEDVAHIKENMATKLDVNTFLEGQDKVVKMLTIIHTEMAATNHALLRHEGRIERLEDDVEELQTHLVIV